MRGNITSAILLSIILLSSTTLMTYTTIQEETVVETEGPNFSETSPNRLTQSAAVAFDEGFAFGSEAHDFGYATTRQGDYTYITGKYSGTMTVGSTTLSSNGPSDIFVLRLTNSGTVDWIVGFGGDSDDAGYDITFSGDKLLVVGYFNSNSDISIGGTDYAHNYNQRAIFVAQLLPSNGSITQVNTLDGDGDDVASAISSPNNDLFRIAGHTTSTTSLNHNCAPSCPTSTADSISNNGSADIITVGFNTSANTFDDVVITGGPGDDRASDIELITQVDSASYAVVGHFGSVVDFDGYTLTTFGLGSDGFVAKQKPSGEWTWAANASGEINIQILGVDTDHSGNIYITGEFAGETKLYDYNGDNNWNLTPTGFSDAFVGKLTPNGVWNAANKFGGPFNDLGISITVDDRHDTVYVGGAFHDALSFPQGSAHTIQNISGYGNVDGFIAAFSESSLDGVWISDIGGAGRDATMDVTISEEGRVLMTGYVTGSSHAGSIDLNGAEGYQDIFYADINPYLPMPSPGHVELVEENISFDIPEVQTATTATHAETTFTLLEWDTFSDDTIYLNNTTSSWSKNLINGNFEFEELVVATKGNQLLWATPLEYTQGQNAADCGTLIETNSEGNVVLACRAGEMFVSGSQVLDDDTNGSLSIVILSGSTGTHLSNITLEKSTTSTDPPSISPKSMSILGDYVLVSGTCTGEFQTFDVSTITDCQVNQAFITLANIQTAEFTSFNTDSSFTSYGATTWVGETYEAAIATMSPNNKDLSICKIPDVTTSLSITDCNNIPGEGASAAMSIADLDWNDDNGLIIGATFSGSYDFGINSRNDSIEISNPNNDRDLAVISFKPANSGPYEIDWAGVAITNESGLEILGMALTRESLVINGMFSGEITFGATTITSEENAGFIASMAGFGNWISVNNTGTGTTGSLRLSHSSAADENGNIRFWKTSDSIPNTSTLVRFSTSFFDPSIGSGREIFVHYNTDISLTPITKGPGISYWKIYGNLPEGLEFNTTTGEISGRSTLDPASPDACTTPVLQAYSFVSGNSRNSYYGMPVKICITYTDVTNFVYTDSPYHAKYGHSVHIPAPTYDGGPVTSFSHTGNLNFHVNQSDGSYGGIIGSSFASLPVPTKALLFTQALTGPNAEGKTAGVEIIVDANPTISIEEDIWTISTQFTNTLEIEIDDNDATVENFALSGNNIPAFMTINPNNGTITWPNVPLLTNSPQQIIVNASNTIGYTELAINLTYVAPSPKLAYQPDNVTVIAGERIDSRAPLFQYGYSENYTIEPPISAVPGLEFNTQTGRISGNPLTVTTDPVVFTVTAYHTYAHPDTGDVTTSGQAKYTVHVKPPAPKFIHPDTDVTAVVGHAFSKFFHSSEGEVTEWTLTPDLPTGVYFNSTSGEIYGTGEEVGETSHSIRGTNIDGSDSFMFRLVFIQPQLGQIHYPIDNLSILSGQDMLPFSPVAFDGEAYWSATITNPLPDGLTINSSNGIISGQPTTAGHYEVKIKATSDETSITSNLTIVIFDPPVPERVVEVVNKTIEHTVYVPVPSDEPCDCENMTNVTSNDDDPQKQDNSKGKGDSDTLPIVFGIIAALVIGLVLGRTTHPHSGLIPGSEKEHQHIKNEEEE